MNHHVDILITNVDIFDGTGKPSYQADFAVNADRIVAIGVLRHLTAFVNIDGTGLALSPGFIDAHTHDDRLLLSHPDMAPKVSQGVTTVIGGNCGVSLAPMSKRFAETVTPPLNLLDSKGDWFRFQDFHSYLDALRKNRQESIHFSIRIEGQDRCNVTSKVWQRCNITRRLRVL